MESVVRQNPEMNNLYETDGAEWPTCLHIINLPNAEGLENAAVDNTTETSERVIPESVEDEPDDDCQEAPRKLIRLAYYSTPTNLDAGNKIVNKPVVTKFPTWFYRRYTGQLEDKIVQALEDGDYPHILRPTAGEHVRCSVCCGMKLWWETRTAFSADVCAEVWRECGNETSLSEDAEGSASKKENAIKVYVSLLCFMENEFDYEICDISRKREEPKDKIALDSYLIPVIGYDQLEEVTENIWWHYDRSVLNNRKLLSPSRLAQQMGLKVWFYGLKGRRKNRGILFWKEGTVTIEGKNERDPGEILHVPAGTIVINAQIRDGDKPLSGLYHECVHYALHWLFFKFQDLYNDELKNVRHVKMKVGQYEKYRNPLKIIEWQANFGSWMLMLPKKIVHTMVAEYGKEHCSIKHKGYRYECIVKDIVTELNVPTCRARQRLLQLGYWEARGACNYIMDTPHRGHYIAAFSFSRESCPSSNYTFVISQLEMFSLYQRSEAFRQRMATGQYVYVDGHVCINDPKYVVQRSTGPSLKMEALEHIDKCCLRFMSVFETDPFP